VERGPEGSISPTANGDYLPRLLDGRLSELFAQFPALLITGPRLLEGHDGRRHAASIVRLDREAEAAAFRADPMLPCAASPSRVAR